MNRADGDETPDQPQSQAPAMSDGNQPESAGASAARSGIVALLLTYLDNQFYPAVVQHLARLLRQRDCHLLLFVEEELASPSLSGTDALLTRVLNYPVDGLILASTNLASGLAARCKAAGVPVILFHRTSSDEKISSVVCDNHRGGMMAAAHLIENGAQRLAFVSGEENSSTNQAREAGFLQGLQIAGCDLHARVSGEYNFGEAARATRELFADSPGPDAIFVANDQMAFAVLDVLRYELGLRVPEDVQVIGFDNVPQAAWGGYQLTTIDQDAGVMARLAVDLLFQQIEEPQQKRVHRVVVPVELIERGTTRKLVTAS